MEFNEKLQELRKQKGLTQEELAQQLFVSRTAISKWESGRGYPNIDSLKAIAKLFSVTVDELLSGDELLVLAEDDQKRKELGLHDRIFGLLDICAVLLLFLPFFGQETEGTIHAVSLLSLKQAAAWLRFVFWDAVSSLVLCGILILALQNWENRFWVREKRRISLILNVIGALIFIISQQPYAAVYLFIFLVIKVFMLIKKP